MPGRAHAAGCGLGNDVDPTLQGLLKDVHLVARYFPLGVARLLCPMTSWQLVCQSRGLGPPHRGPPDSALPAVVADASETFPDGVISSRTYIFPHCVQVVTYYSVHFAVWCAPVLRVCTQVPTATGIN